MNKRTVILGGGTFNHIRNHLSLSAPAFGSTAKQMHKLLPGSELALTKMANSNSRLITNNDVSDYIDELIQDENVGTIIMNVALCDFEATINGVSSGSHAERLKTAEGSCEAFLNPSPKIIGRIRKARPDIFLVGFKTTTGADEEAQFLTALKFMKSTKCNLVLANDVVTRNNMIITPEETRYSVTVDRKTVIKELCDMIGMRQSLTYHRTKLIEGDNVPIQNTPEAFQKVLGFLVDNGGFIENNGNGFTPGHFCWKLDENTFLSSQRKMDHRNVFQHGLTRVVRSDDGLTAYGSHKPSVGATSQRLVYDEYPDYDCIVHTHNPRKEGSDLPVTAQRPFQCGSLECGLNTVSNMKIYDEDIAAVFLDKHGANILFKSSSDPKKVIQFIKNNIELGTKES